MSAAITWSYDLLNTNEQLALSRLGLFADGFEIDAATAAIAGPDQAPGRGEGRIDPYDVPELVWSLASKSLVVKDPAAGATRYRLLQTIRSFAEREAERTGAALDVARCLASHYLDSFGPRLEWHAPEMLSHRAREVDNLRGLIPVLAQGDPALAQIVACVIVADARRTSYLVALAEGRSLLASLPEPGMERVALLNAVAFAADEAQRPEEASLLLAEAEGLAASVGVPPWLEGRLEQERGIVELLKGDPRRAREVALDGLERTRSPRGRAYLNELLMIAAVDLGDFEEARIAGEDALELAVGRGDIEAAAMLQSSLAEAAWRAGDRVGAATRQLESLRIGMQLGRGREIAFSLIVAARLAEASDELAYAVRLQSSADAMLDELGTSLYPEDMARRNELMETCLRRLGEQSFEEACRSGAALSVEAAAQAALGALLSTIEGGVQAG
jgi:tetratricopeptide (TPR) repeat protein